MGEKNLLTIRKISIIFLAMNIFLTAFENILTFIGIRYYGLEEMGVAQYFISIFELELGLIVAFLVSTSPSYFFFILFHLLRKSGWKHIIFSLLGAASLMNFPAALNDYLALLLGYGPLIAHMKILVSLFIVLGFSLAYILYNRFSKRTHLKKGILIRDRDQKTY